MAVEGGASRPSAAAVLAASVWLAVVCLARGGAAGAAGDSSVVVDGAWRFTAVTDRLIRIEYDQQRVFVDDPTEAFLRSPNTGVWRGNSSQDPSGAGWASLWTDDVTVRYQPSVPPATGSVTVESRRPNGKSFVWRWGDDPAEGNLGGTARTLDNGAETLNLNCHDKVNPNMPNSQQHCTWGLVSKQGWAVVNQTGAPVWRDEWYAPSRNSVDVFVFLHGLDFAGAMKDFVQAAGPPAVPPRYAFGTMFTRWFNFDSESVTELIEEFEGRSFPLDAWIFDMNWHHYGPWGSFTWNRGSYPNLQELLSWIQAKGLPIGANTHDHDGISQDEQTYSQMCSALGRTPSNGTAIPFDLYNKTFAMAQEDIAWRALQTRNGTQGLDFAWIDYQQGEVDVFEETQIPGINPTIVLNRLRCTDASRHGEDLRPMIVSRWGGLGSHKYPVGFSGDQKHTWKGLAFLPWFTSTAANVAFGYWSHDTVGGDHALGKDYELSVRWFQTSAWSPVLRIHDKGAGTGNCATTEACARVVPWDVPRAFYAAIRSAAWQRDELMPYIYTAAFSASSTGLTLTRPMYYEDPTDPAMYGLDRQYLFGSDMIVSPIADPSGDDVAAEEPLGAVAWQIWAPLGGAGWVDMLNGEFASGQDARGVYGIRDVPHLVRQGAVIPLRLRMPAEGSLARAVQPLHAVEFQIVPSRAFYVGGSASGRGRAVDDDGLTTGYLRGQYATIRCNYTFQNRTFKVSLDRAGSFPGMPGIVAVRLSFPQLPPLAVPAGPVGVSVEYSRKIVGPVVTITGVDFKSAVSLELAIEESYSDAALAGFVGLLGRTRRSRYVKDALDAANVPYGDARANITACALAAVEMGAAFAERQLMLWRGALNEAASLLKEDNTLLKDPRRSKFISDMLELDAEGRHGGPAGQGAVFI